MFVNPLHILSLMAPLAFASAPFAAQADAPLKVTRRGDSVLTIPLRKQYVPMEKNGQIIAYKTSYFGNITIGAPEPQEFRVVFDTGSGHLILPNRGCGGEVCTNHRLYDRSASLSGVDIGYDGKLIPPGTDSIERDQLRITFGTGKVVGEFVEDMVCLGNSPEDCVRMRVVLANEMSHEPFGFFAFDGVLGLGFDGMALNPDFSLFGKMTAQHSGMQPRFSVFLARNDEGLSTISFGGHEEERAASDVQWAPVFMPELGYWAVQIKSMRIGDTVIDECAKGECRAIVDTGTSLLGVPRQVFRSMQSLLSRKPSSFVGSIEDLDCRSVPGHRIEFDLGGPVISIGVEDHSRPRAFNITAPDSEEGWTLSCRSLLLPLDIEAPIGPFVFVWGQPVLQNYLTIYDWGSKQVGFATAGTAAGPAELSPIGQPPVGSLAAGAPLKPLATVAVAALAEPVTA